MVHQDPSVELDPLPAHILFDVARNGSASYEWRKAAVRLMRKKRYRQASHPELEWLVQEIEKDEHAEKEVIAVVESAIEGDLDGDEQALIAVAESTLEEGGDYGTEA